MTIYTRHDVYIQRDAYPELCSAVERLGWTYPSAADAYMVRIEAPTMQTDRYLRSHMMEQVPYITAVAPPFIRRHRRTAGRYFAQVIARTYADTNVPEAIREMRLDIFMQCLQAFVSGREDAGRPVDCNLSWTFFRERGDVMASLMSNVLIPAGNAVPYLYSYDCTGYITPVEEEHGLEQNHIVECEIGRRGVMYNVCDRGFAVNSLYRHDDGIWREGPDENSEDEDDDEGDRGNDGLLEYHSRGRSRETAVCWIKPEDDDPLKDDTLTLGFEAEINVTDRRQCVRDMKEKLGDVGICEQDGSLLLYNGFEFISGWSTLGTVEGWASEWCEVLEEFETDYAQAGLHITTSPLPSLHVGRILGFVFDKSNRAFIRAIASRGFCHHSRDYSHSLSNATQRSVAASYMKNRAGHERYQAVNPRHCDEMYPNTIEWRMFKTTTRERVMLARIEFVWAATKFCDPMRCEVLSDKAFLAALIHDHFLRKHTPNLRTYLCGLVTVLDDHPEFCAAEKRIADKQAKRRAGGVAVPHSN